MYRICLKKDKSTIIDVEKFSEQEAYAVKVAAGIDVGFSSGNAVSKNIWEKSYYKEITIDEDTYFLIKSGTVFCKFQEVQTNTESCFTPTFNSISFGSRCTNLPICSAEQAAPCLKADSEVGGQVADFAGWKIALIVIASFTLIVLCCYVVIKCVCLNAYHTL